MTAADLMKAQQAIETLKSNIREPYEQVFYDDPKAEEKLSVHLRSSQAHDCREAIKTLDGLVEQLLQLPVNP